MFRLRHRPFVVIAAVDSGINAYHEDFRLPPDDDRVGVHPSEYIEGYPTDAPTLNLTFDESGSPATLHGRDAQEWAKVQIGKPADVSGTNIIGAATAPDCEVCTYTSGTDFFDTSGHGTGVSSVAGGQIYGRGGPNMIIVPIDASGDGWRWAAAQPWIDLITISWAFLYTFIDESAEGSHEAAASGKISCAASGNFTIPLLFWESEGPSSTVHVGAVDPNTRKVKDYSGFPVDVLGLTDVEAAVYNSTDGVESFGGTSAATPHVCALMARAISDARARLGDFREGPHDGGALAVGGPTGAGALSDGKLTRLELEDAVESTAVPVSTDAYHFVTGGFGLVENTTIDEALKVIFGEKPRPTRTVEDAWQLAVDAGRDAVWGFFPDCRPTPLC